MTSASSAGLSRATPPALPRRRPTSGWRIFASFHGDIHEAMISGDSARASTMLRNPAENDMFYGFDNLSKSIIRSNRLEDQQIARLTLDGLVSLAEAMGARRLDYPEAYLRHPRKVSTEAEVLGQIDAALRLLSAGAESISKGIWPRVRSRRHILSRAAGRLCRRGASLSSSRRSIDQECSRSAAASDERPSMPGPSALSITP